MKIILTDGTEIKNLTLNASTLESKKELDTTKFENNMETVTYVHDDGTEEVKHNMRLDAHYQSGDIWMLCLSEMSEQEKRDIAVNDEITDIQIAIAEVYEMIS